MKNLILVILLGICAHQLQAQSNPIIFVGVLLNVDTETQSKGMGNIGVVASGTNYQAAFNQNPALLGRMTHQNDFHLTYTTLPNSVQPVSSSFVSTMQGMINIDKKNALGTSLKYLTGIGAYQEFAFGLTYAHALFQNNFNGLSFGLSTKALYSRFNTNFSGNTFAFDMGFDYYKIFEVGDNNFIRWNLGTAVTNIGKKLSFVNGFDGDYIPSALRLGTMFSWKSVLNNGNSINFNLGYQTDKLLVPTPSLVDDNNNGIEDYREGSLLAAWTNSFSDAPRGREEELEEFIHKIGIEGRLMLEEVDGYIAARIGRYIQHENKGNIKNNTFGGTIMIRKFYIDIVLESSYVFNYNKLGFAVGYQTAY